MDLDAVLSAIDAANDDDPNRVDGEARARFEGRRATAWVTHLAPDASPAVLVAARAHHLRRWALPRDTYPGGRAGYLRWRRDQKERHAEDVGAILAAHGADSELIERVQVLTRRTGLGTDPEVQLVEDAACLVFLEVQFDDLIARLDAEALHRAVAKTLAKMSPAAIAASATIPLSDTARDVLAAAGS